MALAPYRSVPSNRSHKQTLMPVDWESHCDKVTLKSDNLIVDGRKSRYQTTMDSWDSKAIIENAAHRSNINISLRIQMIEKINDNLTKSLNALGSERMDLLDTLDAVGHSRDDINPLDDILQQCIDLRDEKSSDETLVDDVHRQLQFTRNILRDIVNRLQQLHLDIGRHLETSLDLENRFKFALNIQELALKIDRHQLDLNENSPDGSNLMTHEGQGTISDYQMEQQLDVLINEALEVLGRSKRLRHMASLELNQAKVKQRSEKETIQYNLRKSVHRLRQAINNLQSQQNNLTEELAAMSRNIGRAEIDRHDFKYPLKLAETRLGIRQGLPDFVQRSLMSQLEITQTACDTMDQRLAHSRMTRIQLEEHLDNIRKELFEKKTSLDIDRKCHDIINQFMETFIGTTCNVRPKYPESFPIPIVRRHQEYNY